MPITGKNISLYFHVPFCLKKCPYCHFYSIFYRKDLEKLYFETIKKHLNNYASILKSYSINSVYFGGGTPSLLDPLIIEKILDLLFLSNIEITLEANPENLSTDQINLYKKIGINRISLGVQSFDDNILKILKRDHSCKKAKETIYNIYNSGINNISIDLMYDIMHQNSTSWKNTLKQIKELPINHISLYNLTFEKNTPFYKNREKLKKALPSSKLSLFFLKEAILEFQKLNFKRYEISAFAKNGLQSIHNIGYWTARPFLGFGPSAFSYFENKRFSNVANLKSYSKALKNNKAFVSFEEKLKYPRNINVLVVIHLRLIDGINIAYFEKNIGKIPKKTIELLKKSEYVDFKKNQIKLNEKGLLFYDSLASEII